MSFSNYPLDTRIFRNDGTVVYCKRSNKIKEIWQRESIQEILRRSFSDTDYVETKVNGKYVDYTFHIDNDDFGLEIKNINPKGKSLGLGFTQKEIVARYTHEKFRGLLLSCRGFSENAKDLLERENVHYAILPHQTTPTMSLKEWIRNKRIATAFFSKMGLRYEDPFKRTRSVSAQEKSEPKKVNIPIRSMYNTVCSLFYDNLSRNSLFLTSEPSQTIEKSYPEGQKWSELHGSSE